MSAPIAMLVPAVADPVAPPAGPAPGDPTFEMALGAAVLATAAPSAPLATVATTPILDLVLEGEWTLESTEGEPDGATATTGDVGNSADGAAEAPLIPLEKGLADWFAVYGRQDRQPQPTGDTDSADADAPWPVPAEDADANPVAATASESAGAPVSWLPDAAGPLGALTVRHQVVAVDPSVTGPENAEAPVVPTTIAPPVDLGRPVGRPTTDQGLDPDTLLALRSIHEPIVEIGGFAFPVEPGTRPAPNRTGPETLVTDEVNQLLDPTAPPAAEVPSLAAKLIRQATDRLDESDSKEEKTVRPGRFGSAESVFQPRIVPASAGGEGARADVDGRPTNGHRFEPARKRTIGSEAADVQAQAPAPHRSEPIVEDVAPPAEVRPAAATSLESEQRIARRVDSLLLDLKDDQGDYGRLRVSVSGPTVRATILPNDPGLADRLHVGIRELRQSLEDRGFTEPRLSVQQPKAMTADQPVWMPTGRELPVDPAIIEQRGLSRQTAEEERRDRWADARQERQDHGRQSQRGRDQRQDQRGTR